ncbi:hypothetical protein EIL50_03080 [bacterium NHP-B]|nr:hypothetical protein EIL50_03080 [bacterium NHP-B]
MGPVCLEFVYCEAGVVMPVSAGPCARAVAPPPSPITTPNNATLTSATLTSATFIFMLSPLIIHSLITTAQAASLCVENIQTPHRHYLNIIAATAATHSATYLLAAEIAPARHDS